MGLGARVKRRLNGIGSVSWGKLFIGQMGAVGAPAQAALGARQDSSRRLQIWPLEIGLADCERDWQIGPLDGLLGANH